MSKKYLIDKIKISLYNLFTVSKRTKTLMMVSFDIVVLLLSFYFSICARLGIWYFEFYTNYIIMLIILPVCGLPIFFYFGLYSRIIRFINLNFILRILLAVALYSIITGIILINLKIPSFPRSVILINFFITLTIIVNSRVFVKSLIDFINSINDNSDLINQKNIAIYGVGKEGISLFESTLQRKNINIEFFIDHSKEFQNRYINNIRVISMDDVEQNIIKNKITEIYLAVEFINENIEKKLSQIAKRFKLVIYKKSQYFNNNNFNINFFEKSDYKQLLERDVVFSNDYFLEKNIKNNIIFISGAGGSIGSELVIQSLLQKPKAIILYELNEYALFKVLKKINENYSKYNNIKLVPILGSIDDTFKLKKIFLEFNPNIIFHAAAYKHVSLLETNLEEAFKNNIIGTYKLATTAIECKINNFVNISTDKAVNPTSILGKSKRIAEKIIKTLSLNMKNQQTKFSTVRFGNVIGSSGSVIEIFQKQIENGGPLTVTDPNVKRYLMSTVEASQLVIQSSALGKSGDLFFLEMGEQIKILDLANKMISIYRNNSFYNENKDIKITFTGLKKGEKMHEELYYGSQIIKTEHPKIYKENYNTLMTDDNFKNLQYILKNWNELEDSDLNVYIKDNLD